MGYLPAISLSSRPSKCMFPWSTNFQAVCGKLELLSCKTDPLRALTTQLNYWLQDEYNIWRDYSSLSTLTIKHGTWCTIWMEIRECVMFLHWSSTVCNKLMITWFAMSFPHSWSSFSECTSTSPSLIPLQNAEVPSNYWFITVPVSLSIDLSIGNVTINNCL